jgi:hypothetical protein
VKEGTSRALILIKQGEMKGCAFYRPHAGI